MKWLLTLFGLCGHEHYRRERDEKTRIYFLVCESCGRTVEAIQRTPAERNAMRKQFAPVRASKAKRVTPSSVTRMPKRGNR